MGRLEVVEHATERSRANVAALAFGALGVVFGDIGTSPLYALQTVFSVDHNRVATTPGDVLGVISLVFWSVTLVVSVKYVVFILRADNDGEGGVMALAALARTAVRSGGKRYALVMLLGVLGASLFYGDSVITPAISVMSAIEGLSVTTPGLAHLVVPIGGAIVALLFAGQRFGTGLVGRFFGPVMGVWFAVLAILGGVQVVKDPSILGGLSPHHAVLFAAEHPTVAFVAMGAVVLSITGAEALYADMGHFGRAPIRRAWFFVVFPALTLNYLGQGALILEDPSAAGSPFFHLAPDALGVPLVILSTVATIIASQAVISGAFSVSRQAERLGYLPRLTVRHTSRLERGQIYVPVVNWMLFIGVLALLLLFGSSEHLATAYGLAVTGTFLITTTLFLIYAEAAWGWSRRQLLVLALPLAVLELTYFAANLTKIVHGGWLPLVIATLVATVMLTWQRGRGLVTDRRTELEGPLDPFIEWLHTDPVAKVPGTAVFLHAVKSSTPLALRENATFNHVIHELVLIVSISSENVPMIPDSERVELDHLGDPYDAITHLTLRFGFQEEQDIPRALALARDHEIIDVEPDDAYYFLSRISLNRGPAPTMRPWRKRLFLVLAHNAASPTGYFHLPEERTLSVGATVTF